MITITLLMPRFDYIGMGAEYQFDCFIYNRTRYISLPILVQMTFVSRFLRYIVNIHSAIWICKLIHSIHYSNNINFVVQSSNIFCDFGYVLIWII